MAQEPQERQAGQDCQVKKEVLGFAKGLPQSVKPARAPEAGVGAREQLGRTEAQVRQSGSDPEVLRRRHENERRLAELERSPEVQARRQQMERELREIELSPEVQHQRADVERELKSLEASPEVQTLRQRQARELKALEARAAVR
jgi:hypothetical protein